MSVQTLAIIVLLASFFVMIFLRFPIAYAVGLSSVLCMMVQGQALTDVCRLMVKGISSFSLMAVPFFITMGVLMGSGGISEKLIALPTPALAGCAAAWPWSTSWHPTSLAAFPVLLLRIPPPSVPS